MTPSAVFLGALSVTVLVTGGSSYLNRFPGHPGQASAAGSVAVPPRTADPLEEDGIPPVKQREIFRALTEADRRAALEAASKYRLPDQLHAYARRAAELRTRYRADVIGRYRITPRQMYRIIAKGTYKSWFDAPEPMATEMHAR
ncbi:hypothetical protein HNR42_000257 [Deinobacterium chartae]|uniref:Uncharacterized protein n=1 Tax=Deinobacterium chartae TaxID=521158 RepID=A0A841HYI8_9DEIO|nr:hypothetical protein [Deinobacterium chartae]MBB6096845.1 hypothetical protein [Deinobacterium chartae]